MVAYTSPLAIPYGTDADTLHDLVTTIPQAMAEKVDDLLAALQSVAATPWTAIPGQTAGWTGAAAITRRAGITGVNIELNRSGGTWAGGEVLGVIPVGSRPIGRNHYAYIATRDQGSPVLVIVDWQTGQIRTVIGTTGGGGALGQFTFPS